MGLRENNKKRRITIIILIIACVLGIAVFLAYNSHNIKDCGAFSLQTYSDELQTDGFISDKKYGEIQNYREAAECAKLLLKEDYSSLNEKKLNKYRLEVYFDEESDVWLVYFTLKSMYVYNVLAADYYVIISADGDVIARWGVK